jgi:hypothetical protein
MDAGDNREALEGGRGGGGVGGDAQQRLHVQWQRTGMRVRPQAAKL